MSTEPLAIRAAVTEAEKRAGRRQTRLLIVALLALSIIAGFSVAGFFLAYSQAVANGKKAKQAVDLQKQVVALAEDQVKNGETGRAILKQVASFTDPSSPIQREQQGRVAGYLQSLITAQQTLNQDQLRKLGEMAVALGAPKSLVDRILKEPAPVITFGPAPPKPTPSPAGSKAPSSAPAHIQSLPYCPDAIFQVAPAGLVGICITAHPK